MMTRNVTKTMAVMVTALALTTAALAQETTTTDSLAELRQEAQRLTVLAQVPEEARAEAEELLTRFDALTGSVEALEIERLQAYIAALREGDSPAVAQEVASAAVADGSVELSRDREALLADVRAFVERYPEVARMFAGSSLGLHAGMNLVGEVDVAWFSEQVLDLDAPRMSFRSSREVTRPDGWQRLPGSGFTFMVPFGPGQ